MQNRSSRGEKLVEIGAKKENWWRRVTARPLLQMTRAALAPSEWRTERQLVQDECKVQEWQRRAQGLWDRVEVFKMKGWSKSSFLVEKCPHHKTYHPLGILVQSINRKATDWMGKGTVKHNTVLEVVPPGVRMRKFAWLLSTLYLLFGWNVDFSCQNCQSNWYPPWQGSFRDSISFYGGQINQHLSPPLS